MIRRIVQDRPALAVGVFTLCWAVMEIIAPSAGVSPYQIVWTRYGVHLILLALIIGRRRPLALVRTKRPVREAITSLMMLGMPVCYVFAARRMPSQDTMAIFWLAPVLVIALALMAGQPLGGKGNAVGVAVGLIGALLICKPDAAMLRPAAMFALGMSLCFAAYVVMIGTMQGEALSTKLFHTGLWVFAVLTLDLPQFWQRPTLSGIGAMALVGVIGLFGLYILDQALERTTPASIAPVLYTQLAWDATLHMARHFQTRGELPDPLTLIGVALIFVAAAPALIRRRRAETPVLAPREAAV